MLLDDIDAAENKGVDNPAEAADKYGTNLRDSKDENDLYTSKKTNIVSQCNLNLCESPSALTHKIFGHVNYTWEKREYPGFLGIGAEAEFSSCKKDKCKKKRAHINQWGVWIKGGFYYC